MAARWGRPAEALRGAARERAVDLEAAYLASGLRTIVYALAPERVILGGGVTNLPGLLPRIRERLADAPRRLPGPRRARRRRASCGRPASARSPAPRGALAIAEAALGAP